MTGLEDRFADLRSEVDLAQLAPVFTWWPQGPISSRWPAPSGRRHYGEIRRRADLLVVVPAGDVEHR